MYFVSTFFINILVIVFVPFLPHLYPIADLLMQLLLSVTVIMYFKQWDVNLNLFIKNRFILMLETRSAANRLTFMARVMTRAKQIMKHNDNDEDSADKFVKDCQKICDRVYEGNEEFTEEM